MTEANASDNVSFDGPLLAEMERIRGRYPFPKAAMVPVLHVVQRENGWLSPAGQAWVADFLGVTPMEVHEVATFYPMLYTTPQGKHVIHVCRTLSCDTCGSRELWKHLTDKLGVERNGISADGRFSLRAAECLASCGTAPAMLLDGERHENLSNAQVDALLEGAK